MISHLDIMVRWHEQDLPKRGKTACVVRYGGFGDMLQTSSILPGLKEQGYKVFLNTHESSYNTIKDDPHVDEFFLQGKGQVPNDELPHYWKKLAEGFDKFVNLSESVEGTFLSIPGRTLHTWPQPVRHKVVNFNYMEIAHGLADVPMPPKVKFYPTKDEVRWARKQVKKIGGPIILMPLAGSSCHKVWPHMDTFIAQMMINTNAKIVMVGDEYCRLLEQGWEDEKRVFRRSGEWSIRKTLAFAQLADVVVGPETGVLNAVSGENNAKIVMLSHSSHENLTKHWKNTKAVEPTDCECYPCHQLHYSWEHCTSVIDDSGKPYAAKCAQNIDPWLISDLTREALDGNEF